MKKTLSYQCFGNLIECTLAQLQDALDQFKQIRADLLPDASNEEKPFLPFLKTHRNSKILYMKEKVSPS